MAIVKNLAPSTTHKAQELSLKEFLGQAGGEDVNKLMGRFNGGTYMACHVAFYEATGIWIPELVPVFQKMDALAALREDVRPQELSR
jgi:hypothetical protein